MAQSFGFAAFKKAGKFYFLQSSQNIRERGNQLFRRVVIYLPETHGEFRAAPKNAVHFLYGAALHRPGESPWTPYAVLCGTELWGVAQSFAFAVFATLIC